jgi:hypothetical protein
MTLPASGPISSSMVNVEFGRSATANISLENAIIGLYSDTSEINRNTVAGRDIFALANGPIENWNLSVFRGYNQNAPLHWSHYISNSTAFTLGVGVVINVTFVGPTSIFGTSISPNGESFGDNDSTGLLTGTYDTGDILFSVTGREDQNVSIYCYDTDSGVQIYNGSLLTPFSNLNLGTIYRHQRFTLEVTITS